MIIIYAGTLGNGDLASIVETLAHRSVVALWFCKTLSVFIEPSALALSFYMSPNIPAKVLRRFVMVSSESSPVWLCTWLLCLDKRVLDGGRGGGSSDRRAGGCAPLLTMLDWDAVEKKIKQRNYNRSVNPFASRSITISRSNWLEIDIFYNILTISALSHACPDAVSDSFGKKMIPCDSVWMRNLFPNHSEPSPFEYATESFRLSA